MSVLAVIDTNVFIAALFEEDSYAQRVMIAVYHGKIELVTTRLIAKEIMGMVKGRAKKVDRLLLKSGKTISKIRSILNQATYVTPRITLKVTEDDEDDNIFFECAYEADVTTIISQDGDVSAPTDVRTRKDRIIRIYSPWQFIKEFKIKI